MSPCLWMRSLNSILTSQVQSYIRFNLSSCVIFGNCTESIQLVTDFKYILLADFTSWNVGHVVHAGGPTNCTQNRDDQRMPKFMSKFS